MKLHENRLEICDLQRRSLCFLCVSILFCSFSIKQFAKFCATVSILKCQRTTSPKFDHPRVSDSSTIFSKMSQQKCWKSHDLQLDALIPGSPSTEATDLSMFPIHSRTKPLATSPALPCKCFKYFGDLKQAQRHDVSDPRNRS